MTKAKAFEGNFGDVINNDFGLFGDELLTGYAPTEC